MFDEDKTDGIKKIPSFTKMSSHKLSSSLLVFVFLKWWQNAEIHVHTEYVTLKTRMVPAHMRVLQCMKSEGRNLS